MNWKGNAATQAILTLPKPVRKSDFLSALRGTGSDATVPVGERSGEAGGSPRDLPAQTSLGLRVLLAEDNPVNQEVAREFLNSFDCSVTVANDGHEAVAFLTDGSFDIVLMDCQMPALDGLSAVRMYRELEAGEGRRRTPIIAATANAYDSDRAEALAAGMDDYLVKPFSDRTLLAMLQKWKDRSPRRQ
jgi:CheY-like chemotaxis protein